MLATLFCRCLILAQMMLPFAAGEDHKQADAPAAQPAATATTQPAAAVDPDDPLHQLARTKIGRLTTGRETLTFEEAARIETWYGLIRELVQTGLGLIPRMLVAVMFLLVFWALYRALRRMILGGMSKANVDTSIRDMLGSLIKWSVMGFGLVIAFNQIGVQITALLTGVSIIGLAIGFAAQETLSNFIAGIVIFWDKPFRVGDWIEVGDTFGQVMRITFRSTRLLNLDGEIIIFPNTSMLSGKVANHTTNPINRVNVAIGIAYKESIDDARAALLALTTHDERITKDPPPCVVVDQCADSSVNLLLRFWIADESLAKTIRYEYLEKAKKALDAANIQIPFPHLQLLMEHPVALPHLPGKPPESRAA